jgi:predicted nucleic acid-binding protein
VRLALDTNRYVDLCKGLAPTVDLVATADTVYLPFVVVAELRAGFALGRRGADNERVLRRFLQKDGIHLLLADEQTTFHYASVFRHLRERGTPIPTNDMWIAALVLEHNLVLHARDEHFDRLPQLPRL